MYTEERGTGGVSVQQHKAVSDLFLVVKALEVVFKVIPARLIVSIISVKALQKNQ
jgi:hypothetical protein